MSCLYISGVLLALAAAAAPTPNLSPLDYWDQAQLLLARLETIVGNAENTVLGEMTSIKKHIVNYAMDTVRATQEDLEAVGQNYVTQISSLQILADALDAPQCLEGKKLQFMTVFEIFLQSQSNCVHKKRFEAVSIIDNVDQMIQDIHKKIDAYKEDAEACKQSQDDECFIEIIGQLELAVDSIPTSILDEMVRIMILSKDWETAMDNCITSSLGIINISGNNIITEVESCLVGSSI